MEIFTLKGKNPLHLSLARLLPKHYNYHILKKITEET